MNIELLYEPDALPTFDLPDELAALYPGAFGFDESRVFANFVATVDGVVAIPSVPSSNKLIAAGNPADRFVMALLRASADAVVIGAGTLAASPRGLWTPEQAYPAAAGAFAELRKRLGLSPQIEIAVLSASGNVDPAHPVFEHNAIVVTTDAGAARIGDAVETVSAGPGSEVDAVAAIGILRARGHRRILHEGGPHAIGSFFAAGVIDELFLTVSPLLTGRTLLEPRFALVENTNLLPGINANLIGARREAQHLFLRYEILSR